MTYDLGELSANRAFHPDDRWAGRSAERVFRTNIPSHLFVHGLAYQPTDLLEHAYRIYNSKKKKEDDEVLLTRLILVRQGESREYKFEVEVTLTNFLASGMKQRSESTENEKKVWLFYVRCKSVGDELTAPHLFQTMFTPEYFSLVCHDCRVLLGGNHEQCGAMLPVFSAFKQLDEIEGRLQNERSAAFIDLESDTPERMLRPTFRNARFRGDTYAPITAQIIRSNQLSNYMRISNDFGAIISVIVKSYAEEIFNSYFGNDAELVEIDEDDDTFDLGDDFAYGDDPCSIYQKTGYAEPDLNSERDGLKILSERSQANYKTHNINPHIHSVLEKPWLDDAVPSNFNFDKPTVSRNSTDTEQKPEPGTATLPPRSLDDGEDELTGIFDDPAQEGRETHRDSINLKSSRGRPVGVAERSPRAPKGAGAKKASRRSKTLARLEITLHPDTKAEILERAKLEGESGSNLLLKAWDFYKKNHPKPKI